jgi:hypothetical protein
MADICVISVIETYKLRPKYKLCFPSRAFWQATLVANGVAYNLFLAYLFRYLAFGVHFLKDVGLIRSSMLCCKYGSQMFRCVDTNLKGVYRWRCRKFTYASGSIRQVLWFLHSNLNFIEVFYPHVRHRSLIRIRSRTRGWIWRHSSIHSTVWGYIFHPIQYMLAAGCQSYIVDQFTKFMGIVVTIDRSYTPPPNLIMLFSTCPSLFNAVQSSQSAQCVSLWDALKHGWRLNLFIVLCALQIAKMRN